MSLSERKEKKRLWLKQLNKDSTYFVEKIGYVIMLGNLREPRKKRVINKVNKKIKL